MVLLVEVLAESEEKGEGETRDRCEQDERHKATGVHRKMIGRIWPRLESTAA
jgi:hypothetical protein